MEGHRDCCVCFLAEASHFLQRDVEKRKEVLLDRFKEIQYTAEDRALGEAIKEGARKAQEGGIIDRIDDDLFLKL
jgi:hypothetical protein